MSLAQQLLIPHWPAGILPYALNFAGLVAFPSGWTAPNWVVSSNTAKNTPTMGGEIIVNGGFASDTANWNAGSSGILSSIAGGQAGNCLQVENGAVALGFASQEHVLTVGVWYLLSGYQKNGTTEGRFRGGTTAGGLQLCNVAAANVAWGFASGTYRATQASIFTSLLVANTTLGRTTLFDTVSLKALSALFAYKNFGAANVKVGAAWTLGTNYQAGVIARMSANGANYLLASYNRALGTAVLIKVVGATTTGLISAVTAYSAGANVEIRTNGNNVELWYNNAQVGATQAVTDVEVTNTIHGLFSTDVSNTCASFSVEAN